MENKIIATIYAYPTKQKYVSLYINNVLENIFDIHPKYRGNVGEAKNYLLRRYKYVKYRGRIKDNLGYDIFTYELKGKI